MKLLTAILISCLLAACGGGGDSVDPTKDNQPVMCQDKPEMCK